MRRLRGFTLAEALITLALIGVVARLTLPLLNLNVQKQQVGPALMKAINTLKSTNTMALQDNNARNFVDINSSTGYFDQGLKGYIDWAHTIASPTNTGITAVGSLKAYTSPDGLTYIRDYGDEPVKLTTLPADKKYYGAYYRVYVDTNGIKKAPNELGKDVFYLLVDAAGQVIPYGSHMCKTYGACTETWETKCNKGEIPTDAKYCAGAIFDNGGQVKYKY